MSLPRVLFLPPSCAGRGGTGSDRALLLVPLPAVPPGWGKAVTTRLHFTITGARSAPRTGTGAGYPPVLLGVRGTAL